MEEHIYTLLSGALAFPVAWGELGEGTNTPRAAIYRVGGVRQRLLNEDGLMQGRIQVDCYGGTYDEAITASREVRAELERYQGGPVLGVFLDAVRDLTAKDVEILHRVSLTFSITYRD